MHYLKILSQKQEFKRLAIQYAHQLNCYGLSMYYEKMVSQTKVKVLGGNIHVRMAGKSFFTSGNANGP